MKEPTMSKNPWADRILRHMNDPQLAERLSFRPPPIRGLNAMPPETASEAVRDHLRQVYVTSPQKVALVRRVLGICHAHCLKHYATVEQFTDDLRRDDLRLTKDPVTRMLTAEAGLGKTETAYALVRILGEPDEFFAGNPLQLQRVVGIVVLEVDDNTTRAGVLNALAKAIGYPEDYRSGGGHEIKRIRRQLHQAGVMLIIVDELQFLTQSVSAHALVAKTLHFLRQIGIPLVFIGNFSLGHKLLRRPQEDRQRFLQRPEILLPEAEDEQVFIDVLSEFVRVMDGALDIDPTRDAPMFHWYTGGNLRLGRVLIELGYAEVRCSARGSALVSMNDIAAAYNGKDYRAQRQDVEICRRQLVSGKMEREDLWCPFELESEHVERRAKLAEAARTAHLRYAALVASMTPEEKDGLAIAAQTMAPLAPGLELPKRKQSRTKSMVSLEAMMASKPDFSQRKRAA
jgi:hypothetical protein